MIDKEKIKKVLREKIEDVHNLGERAGGSGHLSYRSLSEIEISELRTIFQKGKKAFEVKCSYNIYIETEFEHTPGEEDFLTEEYQKIIIIDTDMNILEISDDL